VARTTKKHGRTGSVTLGEKPEREDQQKGQELPVSVAHGCLLGSEYTPAFLPPAASLHRTGSGLRLFMGTGRRWITRADAKATITV